MPLSVGTLEEFTPPEGTVTLLAAGSVQQPVGTMRATWTDPDGQVWELTSPAGLHGWFTRQPIGGWGAAPVTLVTDPLARGGVNVRHQRPEPRRLTWPLHIFGDTHLEFLDRYRALMRAFTATKYRGPGVLTIYRGDASARSIECLYEDGWNGEPGENWVSANPNVTLFCPDGYFRDTEPQVVRREFVLAGNPYERPYLTVASSQVLGATTIDNPGDVVAYPSWTVTGPATQLVATNNSTGESFTLTYTLTAGQQATITVDPTRTLVRGPAGQNLTGSLNWPGAALWGLLPGINSVTFQVNGSAAGTAVDLSYYARYETA